MPTNDERKATDRAKQEQHFKDIEKSHRDAADLLDSSKREIARSRRLMREVDQAQADRDKGRDDADRT